MGVRTVFNTNNIKEGDLYETNNWGFVEVIEYIGCTNIIVKFLETGNIQSVNQRSLLGNTCADKKAQRVFGVGINDYSGRVSQTKKGEKKTYEKFYLCWIVIAG